MLPALAVLWCTAWTLSSFVKMAQGHRQLAHLLMFVCWAFLVMPLLADYFVKEPSLGRFPRMASAYADAHTLNLYLIYISIIFPVLRIIGVGRETGWRMSAPLKTSSLVTGLALLAAVTPLGLAAFSPDPSIYLKYGAALGLQPGDPSTDWHAYIALSVRFSIFAVGLLLLSQKRLTVGYWILMVIILLGDSWVYGKRSPVAMSMAIVIFALWQRGVLKGGRLALVGIAAVLGMAYFSVNYQEAHRSDSSIGTAYEGFRVDYGRDLQTRTSLYSMTREDVPDVLPEGVSTYPLYAATYVPRDFWPDKPMPYAQYFTSAAFNSPPKEWGWGVTTTIFDEWISNFGLWAMVACPVAYALFVRWASASKSPLLKTVGLGICILLVIQHVTSFYGVFLLWVVLRLVESYREHARKQAQAAPRTRDLRGSTAMNLSRGARSISGGHLLRSP